jgi:hypothetical protein
MTEESNDQILTKEWFEQKQAADKLAAGEAEEERREEQALEDMRQAWVQETGVEPTWGELEKALREKRLKDVAETARVNEEKARRAIHQQF